MTYKPPPCDSCHKRGHVAKSYRLDKRTFRPVYRLLCPLCRARHGFAAVQHDRPYTNLKANEHMRGAA